MRQSTSEGVTALHVKAVFLLSYCLSPSALGFLLEGVLMDACPPVLVCLGCRPPSSDAWSISVNEMSTVLEIDGDRPGFQTMPKRYLRGLDVSPDYLLLNMEFPV